MYHTTDCSKGYVPNYQDIQNLIRDFYEDESDECYDGEKIEEVLKLNLKNLLDKSLDVGEDSVNKAYKLDIYYSPEEDTAPNEYFLNFSDGNFQNCSAVVGGSHLIPISSLELGNIKLELDVCKGSV